MKALYITLIGLLLWGLSLSSCEQKTEDRAAAKSVADPELLRLCMNNLTDVIVYDIFSPPVASRIYTYPSVAAFEIMAQGDPRFESLAGQLTDFDGIPLAEDQPNIDVALAALQAFNMVGDTLIFSKDKMMAFTQSFEKKMKEEYGVSDQVWEASESYARQVANDVIAWMKKDNYAQTRTYPQYTVLPDQKGRWVPTPPDYMQAIEPHWNKIRPFVIDSATQFVPVPPSEFSLDRNSQFFKNLMEVYEIGKNLDSTQLAIAQFWDCNPFVMHHRGHVMYATKKITPGGHWVGITGIATRQAEADFGETAEAYVWCTVALADAFISCWDEKFRSSVIRPETLINQHIDEDWLPLLQTPPFPEYTSGHSVISRAAATALTHLFGDPFPYVDSVEVKWGLPARSFNSFLEASQEAAISRMYGGIHYRPAVEVGSAQGEKVGQYLAATLRTRKEGQGGISKNP